jgi:hypothetical protein
MILVGRRGFSANYRLGILIIRMAMSLLGVRNVGSEVALVGTYSSQLLRRE